LPDQESRASQATDGFLRTVKGQPGLGTKSPTIATCWPATTLVDQAWQITWPSTLCAFTTRSTYDVNGGVRID
jgi:hypothetical protein